MSCLPWLNSQYIYRPQTKFAKVMFLQVSVCPQGGMHGWGRGCAWLGGVHGWGACVARRCVWLGGMHGMGGTWLGGMCGWEGAMHDWGGMHGWVCVHGWGACMAGGCAWLVGACMAHMPPPPSRYYGYSIRSMSGQYASYWNAFLSQIRFRPIHVYYKMSLADNNVHRNSGICSRIC